MDTPAQAHAESDLVDLLRAQGDDTVVPLLLQPRASKSRVVGVHDGRLKVAVAAPPVDGAANKALLRWLAKTLGVGRRSVTLEAGATGRRKLVRVHGMAPAQVAARLGR